MPWSPDNQKQMNKARKTEIPIYFSSFLTDSKFCLESQERVKQLF